jgi:hypothetical protein
MYTIITYKDNKISVTGNYLTFGLLVTEMNKSFWWGDVKKIEYFSSIDSTAPFKIVRG